MSSYLSIYLKVPKYGTKVELLTYSRGQHLYQSYIREIGYHSDLRVLSYNRLNLEWVTGVKRDISDKNSEIERYNSLIETIIKANNAIDEKLELVHDYLETIKECQEEIEQMNETLDALKSLSAIMENYQYSKYDMNDLIYIAIDATWSDDENDQIVTAE